MLAYFKNKILKIILTISILMFFFFPGIPKANAAWMPGLDPIIQNGLDKLLDMINGIIVGTLKQQAVRMLSIQVDMLAGNGSGGKPSFIVNWETYLADEPQNATNLYMNDYISQMTRGRNTLSLYSAKNFSMENSSSYAARLGQTIQVLSNAKNPDSITQLTYEGEPSQMFASNNFKNMEHYLSGVNNPWSFNINIQNEQQRYLENKKSQALAMSIAYQGFRGTPGDSPESIANPGSLVKSALENTQDMPNRILQSASSIPEVATALVTQMINKTVTQGFTSVRSKTSKTNANVNRYTNATNQAVNELGPAARFGVDSIKSGVESVAVSDGL